MESMPISVLIVDDERKACTNLRNLLKEYVDPDIEITGIAHDTIEAEQQINKLEPDALFLDIEMPNENAFRFLERLPERKFEVIFVTAYDEYAVRAFRLNAIDYILKPISVQELRNAYARLKEKINYKNLVLERKISYADLANQVNNTVKHQKITLRDLNTTEVVNFKDIYFVEAQSSYSRVVFSKEGQMQEMVLSSPLSDYEDLLPGDLFYRVHRSYLINCAHIKKIMSDGNSQVVMKNDLVIPVSRRRYGTLISFLETHEYL